MSIKQIKSLITGTASLDTVTNYDFRSTEELDLYLKGLKDRADALNQSLKKYERLFSSSKASISVPFVYPLMVKAIQEIEIKRGVKFEDEDSKVHTIKIPNIKTLQNNFDVVDELHDKIDILDSVSSQLDYMFKNAPGKAGLLRTIKQTKLSIQKKINKALLFLSKVAKGKEPTPLKNIITKTKENLVKGFKNKYTKLTENLYVHTTDDDKGRTTFWFSHYLTFSNLLYNEDEVYPNYYVVITGKINPVGQLVVYMNTLLHYKTPNKFNPGHVVTLDTCIKVLDTLLSADEFIDVLHGMPIPVSRIDIDSKKLSMKEFISDTVVTESTITVIFNRKVTKVNYQKVLTSVLGEINSAIAPYSRNGKLKYKPIPKGVVFTLVPKDDNTIDTTVSLQKIKLLKSTLGLTDQEVTKIIRALYK